MAAIKTPDEWDYQAMEQAINAEIQSLIAASPTLPRKGCISD